MSSTNIGQLTKAHDPDAGKMHINELWTSRVYQKIASASKLLELEKFMTTYKKNVMAIRHFTLEEKMNNELIMHLETVAKVITGIEEEDQRIYRPKDAAVKRGKIMAISGFKASNQGSQELKETSYNSMAGPNLQELKNVQKGLEKRKKIIPKH